MNQLPVEQEILNKDIQKVPTTLKGLNSGQINKVIQGYTGQLNQLLPKTIPAEKFIGIMTNLIAGDVDLKGCYSSTIFGAMMNCAASGLNPDKNFGHCAIVPYKSKAVFQIMYQGWIHIMIQDPRIGYVDGFCIYDGDEYDVDLGAGDNKIRNIFHKPHFECWIPENIIGAYAFVKYNNGLEQFDFMTKMQLETARRQSACPNSPAWNKFPDQMYIKSVIKRLKKRVGLKDEKLEQILSTDETVSSIGGDYDELIIPETPEEEKKGEPEVDSKKEPETKESEKQEKKTKQKKSKGQKKETPKKGDDKPEPEKQKSKERLIYEKTAEDFKEQYEKIGMRSTFDDILGNFGCTFYTEIPPKDEAAVLRLFKSYFPVSRNGQGGMFGK